MKHKVPTLETKRCPFCYLGQIYNAHLQKFEACPKCSGRGSVITNHICACGFPVTTLSKDGFLFCGNKTCADDFRRDKEEAERPKPKYQPIGNFQRGVPPPFHGVGWTENRASWPGFGPRDDD